MNAPICLPEGTSLVATMDNCLPWNTTVQFGEQE